jgi:hypothetical protein
MMLWKSLNGGNVIILGPREIDFIIQMIKITGDSILLNTLILMGPIQYI